MHINPRTLEQIELDLETARGQFVAGQISPGTSEDFRLLASSIAQGCAEIAIAIEALSRHGGPDDQLNAASG